MPAPRPPRGACATHPAPQLWDADPRQDADPTARLICLNACSLRDRCREYALAHREPLGVWGGLSPAERARIYADTTETQ